MSTSINKSTIVALKHLEHDFYKFMKHTTEYEYNAPIVNNERMIMHNNNIKTELKSHINVVELNLEENLSRIHKFICDNFLEMETYKIKIPMRMTKWILQDCVIKALEDENGILSLCAYKLETVQLNDKTTQHFNIKLLCTDNSFRNRSYAKNLLKLIQQEFIKNDTTHGYFVSNINIRVGLSKLTYYYRPLNAEILLTAGFSGFKEADLQNNNKSIEDYYKIDQNLSLDIRELDITNDQYLHQLHNLYNENLARYSFAVVYDINEFKKLLYNENIKTYVVWDDNEIVDFVSYYVIYHESILNKKRKDIAVGNLFMYTTCNTTVYKMVKNILTIMAKNEVDMITILNNMENDILIETLNFIDSQTYNYVYTFNWHSLQLKPNQIGPMFYF
jgi:hypothetical protein